MKHPHKLGEARSLYQHRIHPRLFLGPAELTKIRRDIRAGQAAVVMETMRRAIRPTIEALCGSDDALKVMSDPSEWERLGGTPSARLFDMAMIAELDDDAAALEAVRLGLNHLPQAMLKESDAISVHGRLISSVLAYDLLHHRLSAEDRKAYADWMVSTQVRDLIKARLPRYYKQSGMNLTFGKVLPAIAMVLALRGEPDAPNLEPELKQLLAFFEATLNTALCPNGYPEEDTGYGTDFLVLQFRIAEMLRRSGDFDAMDRCPRLAKSGRAILHIVEPWGISLATTGDAGDHFFDRHSLLPRLATLTKDPTLVWLNGVLRQVEEEIEIAPARNGFPSFKTAINAFTLIYLDEMKGGVTPAKAKVPTQFIEPRRGFVAFRSGWQPDDTLLVFDGSQRSPSAQGHFHASSGHFDLSALGEYFGIDTGRYNMDQDQHNLVLIDGKSGRPSNGEWVGAFHQGRLTEYQPGKFCDFASADSSHQHNCYWAWRSIGLVKGPKAPAYVWTVEDLNKANDWAEYWWTINTCPENVITCNGDRATIRGCHHGNLLDVQFILPAPNSYPKPHTVETAQDVVTCGSYKYIGNAHAAAARVGNPPRKQVHHSVYVRPRLIAKVAGYNGRFMSLMLPRLKGAKPAKVQQLDSIMNSLAVRITFKDAGVEDTIIWAYEHRQLEAGDIWARGNWCVVRRAIASGKLIAYEMGDGDRLTVAGRKVIG